MINNSQKIVSHWLLLCSLCVLIMVIIGGATRLTDSGLSMTDWKPITGILPPLNETEWQVEFSKYQDSPEFIHLNNDMDLNGFKNIFWLEYIHRVAGRVVGIIFFIPALYFLFNNHLTTRNKKVILIAGLLGICQGFMGWYMVKSGLKNSPYVSHFRLTIHLLFALTIFLTLLNEALNIFYNKNTKNILKNLFKSSFFILIIQIALGGLVAGLDAGLIYNEFPFMGSNLWPNEIYEQTLVSFAYNGAVIQFIHRINGFILLFTFYYLAYRLFKENFLNQALLIFFFTSFQFILGILTILYSVPLYTALMHQVFAFILAAILLISYWQTSK